MGKRISKAVTADDFTTTTTVANTVVGPVAAEKPEVVKPNSKDIIVTSKEAVSKHLKALDNAVKACKKGFLGIAFNLYWLKDTCAYQEVDGKEYPTIEAFARDKYDISRSTCLAYIAVVEKFGKINLETNEIDSLKDEFKDYSSTALITMCAMDNEMLSKCNPNMRVKDLKALMTAKDEDEDDEDDDSADSGKNGSSDSSDDNDGDSADSGKNGSSDSSDDNDGDSDGDNDSNVNSSDNRLSGQCLLHINTVEELENKKEYIFEVMKQVLTQKTKIMYTIGVCQLEPPEIAKVV